MRRLLLIGAATALVLLPACSDDDADDGAGAGATTTAADAAPAADGPFIEDLAFGGLEVAAGSEVTVTNRDAFAHTFSLEDGSVTVALGPEETGTFTAPAAGTYEVFCEIHASMTGTLTVS